MRIVAFSNQKGGVAKTTSSYAMAVGLANRGFKVLVVDADPQENLSMSAGIDLNEIDPKWETGVQACRIEIWKYDPEPFATEGCVDPISLAMTMEGQEDERVEEALEAYMENYKW